MNHKRYLLVVVLIFLIFSCKTNQETGNSKKRIKDTLFFVTSTPLILNTPESVCFFEEQNLFFVSNINGNSTEKDQNGYISKIDSSGSILVHKWIDNLDAPKGMAIFDNYLVVTDINRLIIIDIKKSTIVDTKTIENSLFLNDITVSDNGVFYVSDMKDNKIYKFSIGENPTLFIDTDLESPNGLYYENDFLYIGNNNFILKVNVTDLKSEIVAKNTGSIDGIKKNQLDEFIISDWSGNVKLVTENGKIILLLSTEADEINAADFEYVEKNDLILIPTFFNNRVSIYRKSEIVE